MFNSHYDASAVLRRYALVAVGIVIAIVLLSGFDFVSYAWAWIR